MYCINCGVELAAHETKCPLCNTPVCNPTFLQPNAPKPYPPEEEPHDEMHRSAAIFLLTLLFALPLSIVLVCDLSLNHTIIWSGYVIGAILCAYVCIVLPLWLHKVSAAVLLLLDFIFFAGYLYYVNYTVGGAWFLTFALPETAMCAMIACGVIALLRMFPRYAIAILGGMFMMIGVALVATEFFINLTFYTTDPLTWSLYPLVVCVLFGVALLRVAFSPKLQETLKKKFFI